MNWSGLSYFSKQTGLDMYLMQIVSKGENFLEMYKTVYQKSKKNISKCPLQWFFPECKTLNSIASLNHACVQV